jgi:hypothetical protein
MAMRAVRQKVRPDGTVETDKDVLDWLKFAQSETTGIKLYSKDEVQKMNAEFESIWQESIETEVNRRLAERGLTLEAHPHAGSSILQLKSFTPPLKIRE